MTEKPMGTKRPTRRERERMARRQLIINAARKVFSYRGFSEAKLEDVAELAEFGKATLYGYFPTKEALFESVLEDSFGNMKRIAAETLAGDVPLETKLRQFVRGEMEYFYHNPESLHLMMRESHHLRGANPMLRMMPDMLTILTVSIEREQRREGGLMEADPIDLAMLLLNMLFGQVMARLHRHLCRAGAENVMKNDKTIEEFFENLRGAEADQEVERATALICRVYLHGTRQ